ncbi:pseudouridine synthase [Burkholderia sp. BCCIQ04A]|uniref:Dual-specificity RNA pseudouridine synthase RluF n=1 Tax=Burkholderia anthinoferrum TaxID=3090833 RepID=A0ABU5WSN6_9BURK|nr:MULTISPECIES: pseudouridine synthase [Burkholderia]MEB2505680.1 pseudouridine synthase [Burkholderia anthinoferrum]MEB2535721.1 pseudouridine synthase [Burkholderia anthinoferrum]MEB2563172.1 pseudouridine synthase [Burkholderia anthinoferrum]MEB2581800.1 pseudouridine synthase [Burkholderia anthinoferrum]MDF3097694.1 pseudouridine synthase [Burkholderia semiarida]
MRTKLTVKNPKPASPTRAPVRSGSLVARKAVRPAAPPAADKPARPKKAPAAAATGERSFKPRGAAGAERPGADRAPAKRAPRDGGAERGTRAPYRDNAAGEGAKRSFGERRTSSDRPPRRNDDDARPRRAGADEGKRPSYRDNAAGEGAKRGFGERRTSSDRPPRRDDDARPRRTGGDEGKRPSYRDNAAGEGAKRSFGERRTSSDRPPRRDDDARPRRAAGGDDSKRPSYRDKAAGEGAKRSYGDRNTSSDRPPRRSDDDTRPRRAAGGDDSKRPSYRDKAAGEGAKRSYGERRTSSDRPPRRDDDARPRRTAGTDDGKRPSYRDKAAGEGAKRSFGDRPARPARDGERRSFGAVKTAQPVKRAAAADVDYGDETGLMRLSKRMSELGMCSRREADEWIEKGWVLVDGERIDTLGTKVRADQKIEIDERASAAQAAQVTILLHKPVGYVSGQAEDGYEPASVLITRANRWSGDHSPLRFSPQHLHALAPAGRLDIDSTGLLVLTQNGVIAKQLIGEQSDIDKEYLVRVRFGERLIDIDQHFPAESLAKLRHGLELDGVPLKPAMVSWQNGEQLRFVLREGKKRQIRRMCELVGLDVIGLKRVRMGRVMLGALPQGQWRYLSADETF